MRCRIRPQAGPAGPASLTEMQMIVEPTDCSWPFGVCHPAAEAQLF
jgi:hypothetical protein